MMIIKQLDEQDFFTDLYHTDLKKWNDSTDALSGVFLYDIVKDPSESKNLAALHPDLVKQLLLEAEAAIRHAPPQEFGLVRFKTGSSFSKHL